MASLVADTGTELPRAARAGANPPGAADATLDAARLEAQLRERVSGEVRFDDASRALYAADASNYRQVPIGVVIPRSVRM
jgi:FAD/FMN-containing dehydrogenase